METSGRVSARSGDLRRARRRGRIGNQGPLGLGCSSRGELEDVCRLIRVEPASLTTMYVAVSLSTMLRRQKATGGGLRRGRIARSVYHWVSVRSKMRKGCRFSAIGRRRRGRGVWPGVAVGSAPLGLVRHRWCPSGPRPPAWAIGCRPVGTKRPARSSSGPANRHAVQSSARGWVPPRWGLFGVGRGLRANGGRPGASAIAWGLTSFDPSHPRAPPASALLPKPSTVARNLSPIEAIVPKAKRE